MAGQCVKRLPHSCGGRTSLQVFLNEDGTYSGFCFNCRTFVKNPFEDMPEGYVPKAYTRTEEDIKAELAEIRSLDTHAIQSRLISKEVLEYLGVKVGYATDKPDTINFVAFPYTGGNSYKSRLLDPKKFWWTGTRPETELFNLENAIKSGGKRLYITEGEFDTAALIQAMKDNNTNPLYKDSWPPVVSIPHGVSSALNAITANMPTLRKFFKEIVIVFDMDDPGREATRQVCAAFPDLITCELPAKDANACLLEGKKKALFSAVRFNAAKPKNTRLVYARDVHQAAKEAPKFGLNWPWPTLTDKTRGIRFGETHYLGSAQKMGL